MKIIKAKIIRTDYYESIQWSIGIIELMTNYTKRVRKTHQIFSKGYKILNAFQILKWFII